MVTACKAGEDMSANATSTAASNLLRSATIGQGIWAARTIRPASAPASFTLAPPKSQPMTLVIASHPSDHRCLRSFSSPGLLDCLVEPGNNKRDRAFEG